MSRCCTLSKPQIFKLSNQRAMIKAYWCWTLYWILCTWGIFWGSWCFILPGSAVWKRILNSLRCWGCKFFLFNMYRSTQQISFKFCFNCRVLFCHLSSLQFSLWTFSQGRFKAGIISASSPYWWPMMKHETSYTDILVFLRPSYSTLIIESLFCRSFFIKAIQSSSVGRKSPFLLQYAVHELQILIAP